MRGTGMRCRGGWGEGTGVASWMSACGRCPQQQYAQGGMMEVGWKPMVCRLLCYDYQSWVEPVAAGVAAPDGCMDDSSG